MRKGYHFGDNRPHLRPSERPSHPGTKQHKPQTSESPRFTANGRNHITEAHRHGKKVSPGTDAQHFLASLEIIDPVNLDEVLKI